MCVLAANERARMRYADEFFAIERGKEISCLSFKTVAFGFAGTGHVSVLG